MKKTDELETIIKNNGDVNVEDHVIKDVTPQEIISQIMNAKQLKRSYVLKKADMDTKNGYKYLELKEPKKIDRDKFIKILIVLEVDIESIQTYLKHVGYARLYVKNTRDLVIYKGIINKLNIDEINKELGKKSLNKL